jgi:hypothetical protein
MYEKSAPGHTVYHLMLIVLLVISGMVYHFSDLFQYISSGSKENLAEWQVSVVKDILYLHRLHIIYIFCKMYS